MAPVVTVRNLSKKYSRNANAHLSYGLGDLMRELTGKKRSQDLRKDEFYAVNDISFDLDAGDSFALIGRNGSGKTTTLKMLNGLIKPDAGEITVRGRVQALINLGAGFSPNLSGRDNIYNSAALMGLGHRETTALLDEIIGFAELGKFIDSPVGTYSSGMKARLGFAVAVQLKPDILLIDEILSVGDFAFQNKCYTKMEHLKKEGVTIILVSHSHGKILQLCDNALWLHEGKAMHCGSANETVQAYLEYLEQLELKKLVDADTEASLVTKEPARAKSSGQDKARKDVGNLEIDPDVKLGVSEPKVSEPEFYLNAAQETLRVRGWYTAPNVKKVQVFVDGIEMNLEMTTRKDVETLYPAAKVAEGFEAHIDRGQLSRQNELEIRIEGAAYWSRTVIVRDEPAGPSSRSMAKAGLFGPVYFTEGLIKDITCRLCVDGEETKVVRIHSEVVLHYEYEILQEVDNLHMTLSFYSKDGAHVAAIPSLQNGLHKHIRGGRVRGQVHIPDFDLAPGTYIVMMPICNGKSYLSRDLALEFAVSGGGELVWGAKEFRCEHTVINN